MPFLPAIPLSGLAGFRLLEQTKDRQFEQFNTSPDLEREISYFLERAPTITSAEQLVEDRRVLAVVLGAFGLDEDVNKGAFIRKVLEEGTISPTAFANRLVDPAYRELSAFLGFGDVGGLLSIEPTQRKLVEKYRERQFELAVGDVDLDMRLALNFKRAIEEMSLGSMSDTTGWLTLLGSPPLRQVVEAALNLPSQFALIDLDAQVEEVSRRAANLFQIKSPGDLESDDVLSKMVDRFLLNQQVATGGVTAATRGTVALSLLSSAGVGAQSQTNLILSNLG